MVLNFGEFFNDGRETLRAVYKDGTEIWKITRDGRQTLYAVFENKTFKIVDQ